MAKQPEMRRRQKALMRTQEKFGPLGFNLQFADCVRMVRFHLKAMGHKGLPPVPRYSTPTGARLALKAQGVETLEALLDQVGLERIAPAAMLPGDVALMPSEPDDESASDLGTLVINAGRKFIGWHPDTPTMAVMDIDAASFVAAWRA